MASHSIRTRLAITIIGLSALSSLTLMFVAGMSARVFLRNHVRHRLMSIAASGALGIRGDELLALKSRKDEATPTFRALQRSLRALRDVNPGVRYAYVLQPAADPKQWSFVADAEEDPKLASHLGDRYDVSTFSQIRAGTVQPAADLEPTRDRWGTWFSGYAPIKSSRGGTIALLGVDMPASSVLSQERIVFDAVAVAGVFLLVISTLLARRLSTSFSAPIVALAEATERVAGGNLEAEVAVTGSHEIRTLGTSFNAMTEALREHHERMLQLGNTDFLTSLHNHRYFQERLQQEIDRAARYQHPLSLILFDIDHFRQVNAVHGHQGGDDLLQQVAGVIKGAVRECDIPTRYGGEEFAIILPETTAAEAQHAAERVRSLVEAYCFEVRSLGQKRTVRLTLSGGLAEYPADSKEKDGLVLAADVALLRAKHMTRNRVCRFAEDDTWPTGGMDPAELHWALQDASIAAVESLAQALDARDHYTRGHSESVTRIAVAIAQAMGIPKDELGKVRVAGLLHDIGKIGIPDRVLLKQGPLSPEEWELVRAHPSVGADILSKAPMLLDVIPIVLGHHERFDGTGYPGATAGESIPLAARILAVADAYDAMISHRPYRDAMGEQQALQELRRCAGTQFDPTIVAAFESVVEGLESAAAPEQQGLGTRD